jgi:hypothetical protein
MARFSCRAPILLTRRTPFSLPLGSLFAQGRLELLLKSQCRFYASFSTFLPLPGTAVYFGSNGNFENPGRGFCTRDANGLCDMNDPILPLTYSFMPGGQEKNCRSLGFARDDKGWGIYKVYSGWQKKSCRSRAQG